MEKKIEIFDRAEQKYELRDFVPSHIKNSVLHMLILKGRTVLMNLAMFLKFIFESKHVLDEIRSMVSCTMRNKMNCVINSAAK